MTERKFTPYAGNGDSSVYETRNGMRVKVAMVDCGKLYGYLETKTGVGHEWVPHYWCWRGGSRTSRKYDLLDVPVKHTRWVNIYPESPETKRMAARVAGQSRIACIEVTFEEGEGL
jgi:hypothetical protein